MSLSVLALNSTYAPLPVLPLLSPPPSWKQSSPVGWSPLEKNSILNAAWRWRPPGEAPATCQAVLNP